MHSGFMRTVRLLSLMVLVALLSALATIRLSARGSSVTVPDMDGMDLKQVKQALASRGLEMAIVGEDFSEKFPAGCVIGQQPAKDSRVKRGRRVKLTLSRGSEIVTVPTLREMSQQDAEFLVRQLDLDLATVISAPASAPRRTVLAQEPGPGERVPRGSAIKLLVSEGAVPLTLVMPRVTGMSARDALAKLRTLALKITEVTYESTTLYEGGLVLSQVPSAGFRVSPGDEVRLKAALHASEGLARYTSFSYGVPAGPARRVRVIIVDEGGSREITNNIEEGGSILRLSARVQGEAVAQFFIGGNLVEERKL